MRVSTHREAFEMLPGECMWGFLEAPKPIACREVMTAILCWMNYIPAKGRMLSHLMANHGLADSLSDARRAIKQNAVSVNGVRVSSDGEIDFIFPGYVVIKKGKRHILLTEV